MSSPHPHLDARDHRRRQRSTRNLVLTGVMALVFLVALGYVLLHAGRWGVPMFSYTDEYASPCKNGFLGHTCEPLTLAEVEARGEVDLPEDTKVLLGSWKRTHDYELEARVLLSTASTKVGREALGTAYGDCRPNIPNPLTQVQGVRDICTMTNVGRLIQGGKPDPRIWQVSVGTQADGTTLAHLHVKSR